MTVTNALTLRNHNISWGETPLPALIQDNLSDALAKTLGAAMDSIFPAFRSITFSNNAFHTVDGKTKQTLLNENGSPQQTLSLVVLNVAPTSYCYWWEKGYTPGSNTPPNAVWPQDGPAPSNVPDWVIDTKKKEKGKEFKHYSVKRRVVAALVAPSQDGKGVVVQTDTPYVMDLGESSLFMPDVPPLYSFMGFLKVCQSYNTFPFSVLLQLQFDYTGKGAPNTVRFSPYAPGGKIRFFSTELSNRLREVAASPEVLRLLEVNTKTSNDTTDADAVDAEDYIIQDATASERPAALVEKAPKPKPKPKTAAKPVGVTVAQPMSASTADLLSKAEAAMAQPISTPVDDEPEIVEDDEDDAQAALAANMNDLLGTL